jgi:anaerobic magnesium-protoporphyrin IX monomethyl ester cyclase
VFEACNDDSPWLVDEDDRKSPMFLDDKRLDALPWPARHLVDVDSYHYTIDGVSALSLIAQLGCPFFCGFCGGRQSPMLRNIRTRSSPNIVDEIEHLWRTTGRTGFMFYDDELNVNKSIVPLMNMIADRQKALGVEWRFRGFMKSELFTDEQAEAMRRAGFRWLLIGFESGSERILVNINKRATREDNTRCMQIAKRHGLKVKALMSIGHPGESSETIRDTKEWLLEVRPDDFDATVITCYPGTPYYDEAKEESGAWVYTHPKTKDRLYQIEVDYTTTADYYKGDPSGGYTAYVYTDTLSPEDLVRERDELERSVREALGIPYNPSAAAKHYEHSMGQASIPPFILRQSA